MIFFVFLPGEVVDSVRPTGSEMLQELKCVHLLNVGGFVVHVVRRFINVISTSMTLTQDRRRLFPSPQHGTKSQPSSCIRHHFIDQKGDVCNLIT